VAWPAWTVPNTKMPTILELLPMAKSALQTCDTEKVLRGITSAVRLMEEKGHFDFSISHIDIVVCDAVITLPWFVGTVLAVNTCHGPSYLRDNWYQYHINSVGSEKWTDCGYADELGEVCTFRDPEAPSRLVAVVDDPKDSNKSLRVFGFDASGNRIYSPNSNGVKEEGFLVPTLAGIPIPNPTAPLIARIERIQKVDTNGFVRLVAIDINGNQVLIGNYEPQENNPKYRRLRIASGSKWARIKYRRASKHYKSTNDWVPIENELALQLACVAVFNYWQNQYQIAGTAETQAVRMLSEGQTVNATPTPIGPQIVNDTTQMECGGGLLY